MPDVLTGFMKAGTAGIKDPWNEGTANQRFILPPVCFTQVHFSHFTRMWFTRRKVISRATNGESLTQNEIKEAREPRVRKTCVPPQKLYKQCARFNYCRSNSRGEQLIPRSATRRFYLRQLRDFPLKGP